MQLSTEDAVGHGSLLRRVRAHAIVDGRIVPARTSMHWRGRLRLSPDGGWRTFTAREDIDTDAPSFSWDARVRVGPLVTLAIHDGLEHGRAWSALRLWQIPLVTSRGRELDEGAAYRMLAELPWAPRGFLGAGGVRFTEADGRLHAAWSDARFAAAVAFEVRSDGSLRSMVAAARPRLQGGGFVPTPWSSTYDDDCQMGCFRVPTQVTVTWHLANGPFTWFEARIVDFCAR